jgi:hypothetical protein
MSDEKESKIPQATPKQGLETGSVQGARGGLVSGKERVAMEYAKALSGDEGPVAMFDAVDEIAAKRAEQAIDRISFTGSGGATIFGANGMFSVVSKPPMEQPAVPIAEAGSAVELWSLERVGDTGDTYRVVNPGTVSKGLLYDAGSGLEIENPEATFSLAAGHMIWLELKRDLTLTLESGTSWAGWPYAVETELTDASLPIMASLRYPLWELLATEGAPPDAVALGGGISARRMAPPTNLHVIAWVQEGSEARVVEMWWLMPGPGTRTT